MCLSQLAMTFDFWTSDWGYLDGYPALYCRVWCASVTTEQAARRTIGSLGPDGNRIPAPGLVKFTIASPPYDRMWVSPDRITITKRGVTG